MVWPLTSRSKTTFKKNEKNPVCETVVWPLVDRVKNLTEKKWPGLSDSGMASDGLSEELLVRRCNPQENWMQHLRI